MSKLLQKPMFIKKFYFQILRKGLLSLLGLILLFQANIDKQTLAQNDLSSPWLILEHNSPVDYVDWNQDETRIITHEGAYQSFHIWDATDGQKLVSASALYLELAPNKTYLAAQSDDTDVSIWDIKNAQKLFDLVHPSRIWGHAKWNDDGRYILTITDPIIYVWDARTGSQIFQFSDDANETFLAAYWIPDGRKIILVGVKTENGGSFRTLHIWDFDSNSATFQQELLEINDVEPMTVDETLRVENHRVLLFTATGFIRIWNIEPTSPYAGELVATIQITNTPNISNLGIYGDSLISVDGAKFLSWADADSTAHLWDTDSDSLTFGQEIASFSCNTYPFSPYWNVDGTVLALECALGRSVQILLWNTDPKSGEFRHQLLSISVDTVISFPFASMYIQWSPNGQSLAYALTAADDVTLVINNLSHKNMTSFTSNGLRDFSWSPQSRYIVSRGLTMPNPHAIMDVWDVTEGKHLFSYDIFPENSTWNAEETRLAITTSEDFNSSVYIWHLD